MPGHFGTTDSETGVFGSTKATDQFGIFGSNEATAPPTGGGAGGAGVFGLSVSPGGAGVFGANNSAKGVGVQGNGPEVGVSGFSQPGVGVRGNTQSSANFGVFGSNDSPNAPTGEGAGGAGVFGLSVSPGGAGVFGANNSAKGVGVQGNGPDAGVSGFSAGDVGVGVLGQSSGDGPGVFGKAIKDAGVIGFHGDPRLQETTVGSEGAKAGVFGASDIGAGLLGYARSNATPAVIAFGGIRASAMNHTFAGEFFGDVQVNGDVFLPGADCAEQFDVNDEECIEPGDVLVIDQEGALRQSRNAYDKKVAGVVSGAGTYMPGIVLDKQQSQSSRLPVALLGKVFCKVDAKYAPIEVGDLLTSSPTLAHAMKASDSLRAFGAVIGKALRPLKAGQGLIPILIALQ